MKCWMVVWSQVRLLIVVSEESGSGKTQFCHTVAATAQLPFCESGDEGGCIYIDSEGSFRSDRFPAIAARFGLDVSKTMDNISYARAYSSDSLIHLLFQAAGNLAKQRFSLLIVDSATALFRSDSNIHDRQKMIGRVLAMLRKLAEQFHIVVVIANQVFLDLDKFAIKPAGGNVMAISKTQLIFEKKSNNHRQCQEYSREKDINLRKKCLFAIQGNGVTDVVIM